MKVTIPIFFIDNPIDLSELLGHDIPTDRCERLMTFYKIDAIAPYLDEDRVVTSVFSGGREFLCPLPPSDVEKIIDKAMNVGIVFNNKN